MPLTPREALSNLAAAVTGDDILKSGLYVGSFKQHTVLQDSIEVLSKLVSEDEQSKHGGGQGD